MDELRKKHLETLRERGQPIHLIPVDDLHTHTENTTCDCEPKVEEVNGTMLITHNSFDGREAVEEVKAILRGLED